MPVSVVLGRSVVSSLAAIFLLFCFCGYIAFVLRLTAIPAVRMPVCTLYSKLTCSCRNLDVSAVYIMLIRQSTGIVIRGMTSALSLSRTSSYSWPTDVPLVCACAHCCTISRKLLAYSAINHMKVALRGNSTCSIISREFNMLACVLTALASGSFARFRCDASSIHFFKLKKQNGFVTLLVLLSCWQQQSNCTRK